jgi:predicted metal-dependent hydrolase
MGGERNIRTAVRVYECVDFENDDGMRSLLETALRYLRGVPSDRYAIDVIKARTTFTDPAALVG